MARSKIKFAACLAAVLVLSLAAAAQQPELVERLQQRYSATQTFRARFVQRSLNKQTGLTTETAGSVAFRKPGMMRWDYEAPHAKSLITDGNTLWIYLPEQKQVYMELFNQYYSSQLPVLLLSGQADLRQQFAVSQGQPDAKGLVPLTLKPKVPTPGFSEIKLIVDPAALHVVGTVFLDAYGNRTEVSFSQIETDVTIPEGRFIFTPPPGVEVISNP